MGVVARVLRLCRVLDEMNELTDASKRQRQIALSIGIGLRGQRVPEVVPRIVVRIILAVCVADVLEAPLGGREPLKDATKVSRVVDWIVEMVADACSAVGVAVLADASFADPADGGAVVVASSYARGI